MYSAANSDIGTTNTNFTRTDIPNIDISPTIVHLAADVHHLVDPGNINTAIGGPYNILPTTESRISLSSGNSITTKLLGNTSIGVVQYGETEPLNTIGTSGGRKVLCAKRYCHFRKLYKYI